jgi:hypothetical protein
MQLNTRCIAEVGQTSCVLGTGLFLRCLGLSAYYLLAANECCSTCRLTFLCPCSFCRHFRFFTRPAFIFFKLSWACMQESRLEVLYIGSTGTQRSFLHIHAFISSWLLTNPRNMIWPLLLNSGPSVYRKYSRMPII